MPKRFNKNSVTSIELANYDLTKTDLRTSCVKNDNLTKKQYLIKVRANKRLINKIKKSGDKNTLKFQADLDEFKKVGCFEIKDFYMNRYVRRSVVISKYIYSVKKYNYVKLNEFYKSVNESLKIGLGGYNSRYIVLFLILKGVKNMIPRKVTVPIRNFRTYDSFEKLLREITDRYEQSGEIYSDVGGILYYIMPRFDILYERQINAGIGDIKYPLFELEDINFEDGYCFDAIMNYLGEKTIDIQYPLLEELKKHLEINNININILENKFKINDLSEIDGKEHCLKYNNKKIDVCEFTYKINDAKKLYDCKNNNCKNILFGDNHVSLIKGEKILYTDNCHAYMYHNEKLVDIHTIKEKEVQNPKEKLVDYYDELVHTIICFFDIETIADIYDENVFKPYSISYYNFDGSEEKKDESDKDIFDYSEELEHDEFREKYKPKNFYGFDCIDKFIKEQMIKNMDKKVIYCGFNNSAFDNYFIIEKLLKMDLPKSEFNPENIMYCNSDILNFKLGLSSSFDLSKHLTGSLKKNCESFGLKICKLDFDHDVAQNKYSNNELLTDKQFIDEVKKYNDFDVLSTMILYLKYDKFVRDICFYDNKKFCNFFSGLYSCCTINHMMIEIMKKYWSEKKIKTPKFKLEFKKYYDDILKFKSAGRCEIKEEGLKVNEKVIGLDIKSAYPYQMFVNKNYYPSGIIIETKKYVDGKLGYYYCDIDQSKLKVKIQCEKLDDGSNDWQTKNKLINYFLNTKKIDSLIKEGAKVVIKNGIYFTDEIRGYDLFLPLVNIMKIKSQEDLNKINNPTIYNPCLREIAKLMMTCVTGKMIEKIHTKNLKYKHSKDLGIDEEIHDIIGDYALVDEHKDICKIFVRNQRPIYYTDFIYTHTQLYLYENAHKIAMPLYCDTDSAYYTSKDSKKIINKLKKKDIEHWEELDRIDERYLKAKMYNNDENLEVFGSFSDQFKEIDQKCSIFLKKKRYAIISNEPDESIVKIAGIHIKRDDKTGKIVENDVYLENDKDIKDLLTHYNENKSKVNDWEKIFTNLSNGEDQKFLCSRFKRDPKENTINYEQFVKVIKSC